MYSWSIHFFCFVCLVGRQKREEGRKGGENTRVPARPALARLLILLAVYFLMYRVFFFFFNSFYSVSGQSYWLRNQFDNSFIKHCKKHGRNVKCCLPKSRVSLLCVLYLFILLWAASPPLPCQVGTDSGVSLVLLCFACEFMDFCRLKKKIKVSVMHFHLSTLMFFPMLIGVA